MNVDMAVPSSIADQIFRNVGKRDLPQLSDFDIPENVVAAGKVWSPVMLEMADHIGAYHTLVLCDYFGGQEIYIGCNEDGVGISSLFGSVLPPDVLRKFKFVFAGTRFIFPTARRAIAAAKRASVMASVRFGLLTVAEGAIVLGTSRTYLSYLLNQTDEGAGVMPDALPERREVRLLARVAELIAIEMGAAGIDPVVIANVWRAVIGGAADVPSVSTDTAETADPILSTFLDVHGADDAQ